MDRLQDKLPNFEKYVDGKSEDVTLDFAYEIDGYEAPYGKAQMVMLADKAVVEDVPKSAEN